MQCEDPKLMQCGLEKCVASDGSVEWVSSHSKARLSSLLLRGSGALTVANASHALAGSRSLIPTLPLAQTRFMREGAKSLIWNQHSLGLASEQL